MASDLDETIRDIERLLVETLKKDTPHDPPSREQVAFTIHSAGNVAQSIHIETQTQNVGVVK